MGKIEKSLYKENPKVAARSDVSRIILFLSFLHILINFVTSLLSNRVKSRPTVMLER